MQWNDYGQIDFLLAAAHAVGYFTADVQCGRYYRGGQVLRQSGAGGGGIDQCAHQRVHESVYRNFAGSKCTDGAFLCGGA